MTAAIFCLNAPASRGAGGRWPTQPTIIRPGPHKPLQFTDVDALARHIHRQRGRRGLQIKRTVATYAGSDTFPAFEIRWLYDDSDEYAFTAAIQCAEPARLEAALAAANPDTPEP